MFGKGLVKGLQITLEEFFSPKLTVQYPDEQHTVPERFHGRFVLDLNKCIACGLCANACPNRVISMEKQKVGKKQYLTEYVMSIQYCMFCGLCVENCNKDALHFSKDFDMNQYFYRDIPLVLARREVPAELIEAEAVAAEAAPKPKAKVEVKAEVEAKAEADDKPSEPEPAVATEAVAEETPNKEGQ
jgi:NADH-quinone oxidoreductase subunit I